MDKCSWCGRGFIGVPVAPGCGGYVRWDGSREIVEEYELGFCSDGCAWRWGLESHRIMGMTGREVRRHLINEHGLFPGVPASRQSKECIAFFAREVKEVVALVSGAPNLSVSRAERTRGDVAVSG